VVVKFLNYASITAMGKKKDKKKGHGAEKTAFKTDKKQSKREKKNLAALGEEDIESMLGM